MGSSTQMEGLALDSSSAVIDRKADISVVGG